ncbi:hypothetical protein LQZ18_15510 [Lachnospiraceae bacterium ZAX-1]
MDLKIRTLFSKIYGKLFHKMSENSDLAMEREERKMNVFLPKLRVILEQVLQQKELSYQTFRPLLIDTDMPVESLLEEDDVEIVLKQLSKDLNSFTILTDRPEYFTAYVNTMYEETGLVVLLADKRNARHASHVANVILDLEQRGGFKTNLLQQETIYIPIYKKPWRKAENLDIFIPIGYNTMIIKEN